MNFMKKIFITGASRGLGFEFTKQYLERGDYVIASCRKPEKADDLKEMKTRFSDRLTIVQLDVADEQSRNTVFEEIEKEFDNIDILINNAGIISGNEEESSVLGEIYKEDFSKVFLVNTIAPLLMSERFLPLLENSSNAKIVNISSQNGSIALRNVGGKYSYSTSKAALNMVTKVLSNDLRDKGIVALAIHPGWIKTDMGGSNAPLEIEEPISQIIDLTERSGLSDSGKFLDREGKEVPW
ncbi:MAG: C-factor [Candidatus Heimdallarchaeota archaeon AB_125]|nr:MAG: C-factor [Candidatus Heimdallarchaeota archaeon AB_125]